MNTGDLDQLVASATRKFTERFGRQPKWIVAAPGRVNIIGEHIDYNDGFVLPMAIERYCVIAAGPAVNDRNVATVYSASTNEDAAISLLSPQPHEKRGHWSNYFAGVVAGCLARNMRPKSFDAVVESSVPVGGGLSSSASFEVATATLIETMIGMPLDPVTKALLCQRAEHEFAGVPCGIMDQFASAMCQADHLMLLDCRTREIAQIPFINPNVTVLIINTNVKHELSGGEYAERRGQCESAVRKLGVQSLRDLTPIELDSQKSKLDSIEFRRARHAVTEIARTVEAAANVKAGNWSAVGKLMYASHESLRDDFEVSCRELDLLVEFARKIGPAGGIFGSRMTGGGFGGCAVSLVESDLADEAARSVSASYRKATGIEATVIKSRPGRGAHVVTTP
jgi:galactokinase